MNQRSEHLKALGFELVLDSFILLVLILAYKYTFDTFSGEEATSNMNFMRNAFVFIAPSSVEGFRIIVSTGRDDKHWDIIEISLSVLCILIAGALMIQCIFVSDVCAELYVLLIAFYPLRVVVSVLFEFINLVAERR